MTYSCADFADDVFNTFFAAGLLAPFTEEEVQDRSDIQAKLVLDAFEKLLTEHQAMEGALASIVQQIDSPPPGVTALLDMINPNWRG